MNKKILFALFIASFILTPRPVLAGFMDQLLESVVGGNSSNSGGGNGSSYRALQDRSQTLREDEQRLDEAYSQLRQKQAAGQDTTAELQQIQLFEQTYRDRKQQVRELQWQAERDQEYARRRQQINYDRQRYASQTGNYSNNGYQQDPFDNGWGNDPYGNQNGFQDDDNDGFRVRFGG